MPKIISKSKLASWFASPHLQSRIQTLFSEYLDLPLFYIPANNFDLWYTLAPSAQRLRPLNFELFKGKKEARLKYNYVSLKKTVSSGKAVEGEHAGMHDLFVPVGKEGILVVGSYMKELPQRLSITRTWKMLNSSSSAVVDDDLLQYTRLLCEAPLIEKAVFKDLKALLGVIAELMLEQISQEKANLAMDPLNSFYSLLPTRMWQYVAAKRHRLFWGPNQGLDLASWDQAEWGLQKSPNTVIAVAPQDRKGDSLDRLLFIYRMQRESFSWVKGLKQSICGPMGRQGLFFLCALEDGKNKVQSNLTLKDTVLAIRKKLEALYGGAICMGAGTTVASGLDLPQSYRQAVTALQLAQHHSKDTLFFDQLDLSNLSVRSHPSELAVQMAAVLAQGAYSELEGLREQYLEELLLSAGEDLGAAKAHVATLLLALLKVAAEKSLKSATDHRAFRNRLLKELEMAQTIHEVTGLVQHWEEACRLMMSSASRGRQHLLLEDLARTLRGDLSQHVSLAQAAKLAGMSTSHFTRAFKNQYGSAYASWMLRQRLEEACRVLQVSQLAIQQVADTCGFSSPSHFNQVFQKWVGKSPAQFRRNPSELTKKP